MVSKKGTRARKVKGGGNGGQHPNAGGSGKETPEAPPRPPARQSQMQPQMNFHMVPAPVMGDVLEILRKLPWEDVYKVMPQLSNTRVVQGTPKE